MNWNGFFTKKRESDGFDSVQDYGAEDAVYIPQEEEPEAECETAAEEDVAAPAEAAAAEGAEESAEAVPAPEAASGNAYGTERRESRDGRPSSLCEFDLHVRLNENGDVGRAAIYLAMSEDIADERHVKDALAACGWKAVATEIGGISGNISLKASRAIVGAALNSGVVRKTPSEMHALMHAAQEAFSHFITMGLIECSVGAKIAIVRNSQWLAVAVSGDTAYHAVAHHERVGVGVMHL